MTEWTQQFREAMAQARWDAAMELLRAQKPDAAGNAIQALPYEQQRRIFRRLPTELAASLVPAVPYYHAYVLLHSRPMTEIVQIIDAMHPAERDDFLEA